ncbi:hypothetical protein [Olsenella sp. An290]|uniref:hypothetical protein n=1 Tax=Olsenella sp. An290 TaxID=1965625 RepID=UPI000B3A86DA|nr:hypothetical protein [Olsenella sp. An290]OUO34304.1 hypothetical protein B5F84_06990 [Olsenella sp. An290]
MRTQAIPTTLAALALVAVLGGAGCTPQTTPQTDGRGTDAEEQAGEAPGDAFVSTALVVRAEGDEVLFVDRDTEAPYFPTLPAGTPELAPGNVVRVTGNGIMLESYPAQYPGITSVELIDEGAPEDADEYQDLVSQIWAPRDPAAPASALVEYRTDQAVVSLVPLTCGYEWSYGPAETRRTIAVDAPAVTDYAVGELPDATLSEPTEVTMTFEFDATDASVTSWDEGSLDAGGTAVDVALEDGQVRFTAEPGARYAAEVAFEDGTVTYGFTA